jgi:hypothetical protein
MYLYHVSLASHPYMVRKMHPTLLLPTLFYFASLLTVVPVSILFIPVFFQSLCHELRCDVVVRKRGRVA